MERKHLPKIKEFTNPITGGWYIGKGDQHIPELKGDMVYIIVPNIQGAGRLTNHSIERDGEVNASVLQKGVNKKGEDVEYHEFVILDDWDNKMSKEAGKQFITNPNK